MRYRACCISSVNSFARSTTWSDFHVLNSLREQQSHVQRHAKRAKFHIQSSHMKQKYTQQQQTHYKNANVMYCILTDLWIGFTSYRTSIGLWCAFRSTVRLRATDHRMPWRRMRTLRLRHWPTILSADKTDGFPRPSWQKEMRTCIQQTHFSPRRSV